MLYYYGWSWSGVLFMILGALFWLGILGLLLWVANRWTSSSTRAGNAQGEPPAHEMLARRFARGEIDTATYEDMLVRIHDRTLEPTSR
jgi:uncharacterized membrane protein